MRINIKQLINRHFEINNEFETYSEYNVELTKKEEVTKDFLENLLKETDKHSNSLKLKISNKEIDEFDDFLNNTTIEEAQKEIVKEKIRVIIKIEKNKNKYNVIYSFDAFSKFINAKNLKDIQTLWKTYGTRYYLNDEDIDEENTYFIFSNNFDNVKNFNGTDNTTKIENIKKVINSKIELIHLPEELGFKNKKLDSLFKIQKGLFSLICISNYSEYHETCKKYLIRFSGYKTIEQEIKEGEINQESLEEYYKIYTWVYSGANISDKLGLAQNVISLHLKENELNIDKNAIISIKSSHSLYLKENVDKYLQAKTQVSERIYEYTEKINEIIDTFYKDFKGSIVVFFTFIFSVFVMNVLSTGKISNIFVGDITKISYGTVLMMGFVFIVRLFEYNYNVKKYNEKFLEFKTSYEDIFEKEDLEKIFNNNNAEFKIKNEIKTKRIYIISLWISTWIIFLSVIIWGDYSNKKRTVNTNKEIIIIFEKKPLVFQNQILKR